MLFLMAFLFLIVAFATAITALHHSLYEFTSVDKGMETLLEITLGSLAGLILMFFLFCFAALHML